MIFKHFKFLQKNQKNVYERTLVRSLIKKKLFWGWKFVVFFYLKVLKHFPTLEIHVAVSNGVV